MQPMAMLLAWTALGAPMDLAPHADDLAFFEKKVRPLLVQRCHSCHSAQAKKQRGGLSLDVRSSILQGGDTGPALVPGKPEESLLIRAVRYGDTQLHMPPKGKLPSAEVAILEEWVRRGAVFPGTTAVEAKTTINLMEGRKFWSFQRPKAQLGPAVRQRDWPRREIDPFLLAEMEKHGLTPSSAASRRTLIRRVTFDLTGLPPTPEQVSAFLQDTAIDAYEQLVDRLLASPAHGERWARFWLDLTRYRDSGEEWGDIKAPGWVYRDWVVRAFNEDLPYDRFVQNQVAADLIPGADSRDRAALGFLGLSPTYWKELQLDPEVIKTVVAEEWEERIGAFGATFLGLTIACARCHDHKFDPITQHDYYALAGIFASSKLSDRPLVPDSQAGPAQRAHEQARVLQAEIDKLRKIKQPAPDASRRLGEMSAQLETLRKTPFYDALAAPGVAEASLTVLADGPNKTKLVYHPNQAMDVAVQIRGNPSNLGPVVPRRFLEVLTTDSNKRFSQGSGRLELARALVNEGAPLTARVIVNRIWKHHFGAGLVDTPSDFGAQGARPTHPALLDDLTARFIASGWSLKWLHREIVLSAAYCQASTHDAGKHAVDPDNRWLWRSNRRRLEIEAWRDAMLTVAGVLDCQIGGASLNLSDPANRRRTLYGNVKRRELHDLLRLYDFPDPTTHSPKRIPTTTALQQLFVLNSPFIQRQSAALAARLKTEVGGSVEGRVRRAYTLLFGRPATDHQIKLATAFLDAGKNVKEKEGLWQQYAQALLGSNEFLFVD